MSFEDYVHAVKIDDCHNNLIYSLITSLKTKSILELGYGAGESSMKIQKARMYNDNEAKYTIVDNWMDHSRKMPVESNWILDRDINIVTSEEKDFITSCRDTFDFILSDADHQHTNEWMEHVYNDILNPGGILIYHDVMGEGYPNLFSIVTNCRNRGLSHVVFDKSSRSDERCERGLLVIFKPR